jgi:Predicted flavin-nucleotide-binding protein
MMFSEEEIKLILSKDTCRLASVSANGWPHLVPVSYVYIKEKFYVPSKKNAKKVKNLKINPKATIVIDDEQTEMGVMIECNARILEYYEAYAIIRYMENEKGWKESKNTVIIELSPLRKASWSLKS